MCVPSLGREDPLRRAWQWSPVLLPGESQDRGVHLAIVHRVAKNWTQLKQLSTQYSRATGGEDLPWVMWSQTAVFPGFQMCILLDQLWGCAAEEGGAVAFSEYSIP